MNEAIGTAVLGRIRELWAYRAWWRANRWADWPAVRHDLELELRALVRLARAARRVEAARPDPMAEAKRVTWANGSEAAYGRWIESELREAFGR